MRLSRHAKKRILERKIYPHEIEVVLSLGVHNYQGFNNSKAIYGDITIVYGNEDHEGKPYMITGYRN